MTHAPRLHSEKVAAIANQLRSAASGDRAAHISKGGVPHFVPLPGDKRFQGTRIDIRSLDQVLEVDAVNRTCTAEPGVTFAELLRATLPHGLVPCVVPELEGITVGGAVAGCSVESMSYRYGGFHDSCLEYEIIRTDGEIATCSREDSPFHFEMIHGSYGTLAILTRLKMQLIPAKPYVRLAHRVFDDFDAFETALAEHCRPDGEHFVDAIVHGPQKLALCVGEFVDSAPYTSDYRRANIYFKSTLERSEDYLETADYCFRYDADCHWMTNTIPPLRYKPIRALVGKYFLGSTNLIAWSNRLEPLMKLKRRPEVVCDIFIPARRLREFFDWYVRDFDFYPLWVIPYRIENTYPWIDDEFAKGFEDELFIDCAVYGKPNNERDMDYSELLERKTTELNGIKTLISRNHFTRDDFWSVFNKANYDRAKAELDPVGLFPNLYDKFHRDAAARK